MSSEKTANLGMHKWMTSDYVKMAEFNENFKKLDDQAGEIKEAKTDIDGVVRAGLPERLTADFGKVTAQLAETALIPKLTENEDMTDMINDFIANAPTGSKIRIPNGTFLIDASIGIVLKSNIEMELSNNTVLKTIPNSLGTYIIMKVHEVENVKITGGTILGERDEHIGTTGEWGHGIFVTSSKNVTIKDVTVKDCWGDGIAISAQVGSIVPCENIFIDNVNCDRNRRQGISVIFVNNCKITNSTFTNTDGVQPMAGIDIEPNSDTYCKNVTVTNCYFDNNYYGIQVYNFRGPCEAIIISGNIINNSRRYGIFIDSDHVLASDNFINGGERGIHVGTHKGNVIKNNYVYNITTTAISILLGLENNVISGNVIKNEDGIVCQYGVYVTVNDATILNNDISGNVIDGNVTTGIYISTVEHIKISNNTIKKCLGRGIDLYKVNNGEIASNYISESTQHGIYLLTCNDNKVSQNTLKDNIGGTDKTQVRFNSSLRNRLELNKFINTQGVLITNHVWFSVSSNDCHSINNVFDDNAVAVSASTKDTRGVAIGTLPTTGTWKKGEFMVNSSQSLLGTTPDKYILSGWRRLTDGTGNVLGTDWVEVREFTGL